MSPLLRLIIISGVGPLLTLHFLIPLFRTFIPIWREDGEISWELAGRLLTRLSLVVLAILWILLTLEELQPETFLVGFLRWAVSISWVGVGLGVVISWVSHPQGMRGL